MTKNDEQTMPVCCSKRHNEALTTQTTYHNPLSQLYFGIHYELDFNQQVAFVHLFHCFGW